MLVLIAVPVFVLGVVAPYAVRLSVTAVDEAGRVAGRLYAISTLGSARRASFLSALLFIPLLGTRRTFLVFALGARGRRGAGARAPLACSCRRPLALLLLAPVGTIKAADAAKVDLGARDRVPVRPRRRGPRRRAARWS